MPLEGEYEPSPWDWVREQVSEYEASQGQRANTLLDTGLPVVIVTMRGHKSGKIRKTPVMRVEHQGEYALIVSVGGAPKNPAWYASLVANPEVMIQDGPEPHDFLVREIEGDERAAGGIGRSRRSPTTPSTRRTPTASSRSSWRLGSIPEPRTVSICRFTRQHAGCAR